MVYQVEAEYAEAEVEANLAEGREKKMGQTTRFKDHPEDQHLDQEKEVLMELADELLQDNYGSLRFRELLAKTDIVDTGLRWQVSNEITRRLVQHVLNSAVQ